MRTQTMHEAYKSLLVELYANGVPELNARTGVMLHYP